MKDHIDRLAHDKVSPSLVGIIVLAIALAVGGYGYFSTYKRLQSTQDELATTTLQFNEKMDALERDLTVSRSENASLTDALQNEQNVNNGFANQINTIASTVGTLTKLSQTDPELLKKYSKIYFLNENYIPSSLSQIPQQYISDKRALQLHTEVMPHLTQMLDDASSSGVVIKIASAYRSFAEQKSLKAIYKTTYGSGANTFSADQGYSEHQLGTALDFTTPKIGGLLTGFEKTDASDWLLANAYKYGFIISYPKSNTYYEYEPWHWRYVGVQLATNLHDESKNFYDMDQREIDTYLVHIFD